MSGRGRGSSWTNEKGRHPRYSNGFVEPSWDTSGPQAGPSSPASSNQNNNGHPKGLKGKAIGMFYANKQKEKTKRQEDQLKKVGYDLTISRDVQEKITQTLEELNRRQEVGSPTPSCTNVEFRKDYMQNLVGNLKNGITGDVEVVPIESIRNRSLDAMLKQELSDRKFKNHQYQAMRPNRMKLPVFAKRKEITEAIMQNQVTVISGDTGSGKTTQIPQFILDRAIFDGNGSICNIICTQPRRISAITVAERVAEERGERIGGTTVGYAIRLENKLPKRNGGTLNFLVTGVLLQRLRYDPLLKGISHVIVDEVHERDVLTDFTLVILKDLISKRPDLKVVLMSATLNATKFAEYFGGSAIFEIPGSTYPVTEYYLEDVLAKTKFCFPQPSKAFTKQKKKDPSTIEFEQLVLPYVLQKTAQYPQHVRKQLMNPMSEELNNDLIQATLQHIVDTDNTNGAVLIFLSGWAEILALLRQLENSGKFSSSQFKFFPLHSMVPLATQRQAFKPPPTGTRKVVLATNIAETSITIDDICFVIDTGRIKQKNFDIGLNLETLDDEWESKANAQQRRGRAGRVQEGVCYYLFSRGRERLFQSFKAPEVQRSKLEEQVLLLKNLKFGNAEAFFRRFMDPPVERAVVLALERLHKIGALGSMEQLTPLGFHLSKLPTDPYTGKMILMAAIFSCLDPILTCAASITLKDCFEVPLGHETDADRIRRTFAGDTRSDHLAVIRAMVGYEEARYEGNESDYCYSNYISQGTLRHMEGVKEQFAQHLYRMQFIPTTDTKNLQLNRNANNIALVKAIIASGLYPNLATAKAKIGKSGQVNAVVCQTHEDGRVQIHRKSVNCGKGMTEQFESPFFVYFKKMRTTSIFIHDTTMVTPFPMLFFGGVLDYLEDSGYGSLGIDGLTRFRSTYDVYNMIQNLRLKLDEVLEHKIQNPGPTCWEDKPGAKTSERLILEALRDLLSTEYKALMNETDDSNAEGARDADDDTFEEW